MSESKIEWTERTWNPIVGCSILTPGCTNCYAMAMAARIEAMNVTMLKLGADAAQHYSGTTKRVNGKAVWTGKVALAPDHILYAPLLRKKSATYFVNSMGDLFHEDVPAAWVAKVFAVMAEAPQHTFQVLTKRAKRMRELMEGVTKPLQNVWLGVSTERQEEADERIPHLLQTPAAVRFISAEPLLGPIDLTRIELPTHAPFCALTGRVLPRGDIERGERHLDWVVVGGESGPSARPMRPDWARSLRQQCERAGVKFFFKQWGQWGRVADQRPAPDHNPEDADIVTRVGKARAGRLLDGIEHNAMPKVMA